jgi:hypothetical protein
LCNDFAPHSAAFADFPVKVCAVSIRRRWTRGDIPAGERLIFPVPVPARE